MKDTELINNPKKRMAIFNSLMSVELHGVQTKTRDELLRELKQLETEGQLRIYDPESIVRGPVAHGLPA